MKTRALRQRERPGTLVGKGRFAGRASLFIRPVGVDFSACFFVSG